MVTIDDSYASGGSAVLDSLMVRGAQAGTAPSLAACRQHLPVLAGGLRKALAPVAVRAPRWEVTPLQLSPLSRAMILLCCGYLCLVDALNGNRLGRAGN